MASDEFLGTDVPPKKKKSSARVWNILTILCLVALACFLSYFAVIFLNPNSSLNPFPPPTLNPSLATPTITVTPRFTLVPTWTPTNAPVQSSGTPSPSETPAAQSVSVEEQPSLETISMVTGNQYAFELQQGSPTAIAASEFHQVAGCDWMGVAGQATSLNGEAVRGLFVQLGGSLPGMENVDNLVMTGLATQYGYGGFEITIADKMIASTGTLWVQLLDAQNLPLSERIYFDSYDDCQKNLVVIYFSQVR